MKVVQIDLESKIILLESGERVPVTLMLKQGGGYTENSGEALAVAGRTMDGKWVHAQVGADLMFKGVSRG